MLDFVKKAFRSFIEIILWINLILFSAAGGGAGNLIGGDGFVLLGVIIGLIIGLLANIIVGGFIATILNIDKNLEEIKNNRGNFLTDTKANTNTTEKPNFALDSNKTKLKANDSVNIRKEAELASEYIFKISYGEIVSLLKIGEKISEQNSWVLIQDKNGNKGWCSTEYFEKC
jgi:hypothetical protein